MSAWPVTRVTLLDRLRDPRDQDAWTEFVALYGPLLFTFARRRLAQDHDAADVVQEVLTAVMRGRYQRPRGRFQKWLVTVLLNRIRDYHAAVVRRPASLDARTVEAIAAEPSSDEEAEWEQERKRHLLQVASDRVRARTPSVHWDVFVRTALGCQPGPQVATSLSLSLTNLYAIKSRIMKEIKGEIHRLGDE
jgi:RNA polymerase sigma-70 factor (ECF subfamily)